MATNHLGQYLPSPTDTLDGALQAIYRDAGTVTRHENPTAFTAAAGQAVQAGQATATPAMPIVGVAGGALYAFDGTVTRQLTARDTQVGSQPGKQVANGQTATWVVTFPREFPDIPLVSVSFSGSGRLRNPAVHDVTTKGCKITADNASGATLNAASYRIHWKAELW